MHDSAPQMKQFLIGLFAIAIINIVNPPVVSAADTAPENSVATVEAMSLGVISQYLGKFGEPSLGKWPEAEARYSIGNDRYRITRLRLGSLLCIRIYFTATIQTDAAQKPSESIPQVLVKQGTFDHPDVKGILIPVAYNELKSLFNFFSEEELFSLTATTEQNIAVADGETWVFEQWHLGRYRIVARKSPRGGPAKAGAKAVIEFLDLIQKKP